MSVRKQSAYWGYETKFHLIPGRLRIGIPGLRKNQELANLIAHRLAKFPGVRLSYANPITGQVLLNFDPAKTDLKPLLTWLEGVSEKNGEGKSAAPAVKKSVGRRIPEKPAPGPEPLPWHTYGPLKLSSCWRVHRRAASLIRKRKSGWPSSAPMS